AIAGFLHDLRGDLAAPAFELQFHAETQRFADGHARDLGQAPIRDEYVAGRPVQARTVALRTGLVAQVFRELLAHRHRFGLAVAPLEIGNHALPAMRAPGGVAPRIGVLELDLLLAAAVQHDLLLFRRELVPRRLDIDLVRLRERLNELEVVDVAAVPAADRAVRERQVA